MIFTKSLDQNWGHFGGIKAFAILIKTAIPTNTDFFGICGDCTLAEKE
ncbi:MAG: hypothetical protein IJZ89_04185 [Clostridia bacterium]|nr:hypothetical protein [Clostridia bacterium]